LDAGRQMWNHAWRHGTRRYSGLLLVLLLLLLQFLQDLLWSLNVLLSVLPLGCSLLIRCLVGLVSLIRVRIVRCVLCVRILGIVGVGVCVSRIRGLALDCHGLGREPGGRHRRLQWPRPIRHIGLLRGAAAGLLHRSRLRHQDHSIQGVGVSL